MFIRTRIRTRLGYGRIDLRDRSFDGRTPYSGKGKVTTYYQAVESYRENGKPRQRILASWRAYEDDNDQSVTGAIARCEAALATLRKSLDYQRRLIPEGCIGVRLLGHRISREFNDARIADNERQLAKEERRLLALQQVRERLDGQP